MNEATGETIYTKKGKLNKLITLYKELNGDTATAAVLANLEQTRQERFFNKKFELMQKAENDAAL